MGIFYTEKAAIKIAAFASKAPQHSML